MNEIVKTIIEETFKSKRQQRYFYAKANDKSLPKKKRSQWKKWAKEFSDKTNFSKLPEKATEEQIDATPPFTDKTLDVNSDHPIFKMKKSVVKPTIKNKPFDEKTKKNKTKEVDEIVDDSGTIQKSDIPISRNAKYIGSKDMTDRHVSKAHGAMGDNSFGFGARRPGARTIRYWAEADMSKALGSEVLDNDLDYEDAEQYFEDELELDPDETEERLEKFGYDKDYPDGKLRLIENPMKFIEEYIEDILKRSEARDVLEKDFENNDIEEKDLNPIIKKQLDALKQTLINNKISTKRILKYLKDNE